MSHLRAGEGVEDAEEAERTASSVKKDMGYELDGEGRCRLTPRYSNRWLIRDGPLQVRPPAHSADARCTLSLHA